MATSTVDAVIPAPRDVVYQLFSERERISPYLPIQVTRTKDGTDSPGGVGAQHFLGRGPVGVTEEITALVPNERMEYKIVKGAPVKRHTGTITFADADNGTRISYTMDSTPALPVPDRILELVLHAMISQFVKGAQKAVRA
ncbi:SRPBCC family protein [Nocardia panacis]|uniref:SRPBCC family protein n=1 Tax=Nocardia panacis TaxID=2340916 RepID=A0A3A4KKH4_9NOCA|nr:SRPBCC family protein [Nocardia panacis]RJO75562.1 SRPBCC family protein [Nocardia panacis]